MMDIWMIASLSLPFLEVILHTIIDRLQCKSKIKITTIKIKPIHPGDSLNMDYEKQNQNVLTVAKFFAVYGLTFCYILFLILFFSIGLWYPEMYTP